MYTTLIADDSTEFRNWLRGLLESSIEFDVVGEANEGASALKLARTLRPDLVIADIFMPESDGIALARNLHQEFPFLRVVLVSAHSDKMYGELATSVGAHAFIPKIDLTVEVLEQVLRQAR